MTAVGGIVGLVPIAQSLHLAGYNFKKLKKKRITSTDLFDLGTTNIIGAALIGETSRQISQI